MTISWKELGSLDVKQIRQLDYKKILAELTKQPLVLITGVVVLSSAIFCFYFYNKNLKLSSTARQEIPQLEEKNKAIESHNKAKKELEEFLDKVLPPLGEEDLMNQIADFAVKSRIQIESFAPSQDVNDPYYHLTSISFNVTTIDYRDLWLFIHQLETKLPSTRIVKLAIGVSEGQQPKGLRSSTPQAEPQPSKEQPLNVDMEIASIEIKKNE